MPQITLTATEEKWNAFKPGFFKKRPIPVDEQGNPTMGEGAWVKECLMKYAIRMAKAGAKELWEEQMEVIGDDTFE